MDKTGNMTITKLQGIWQDRNDPIHFLQSNEPLVIISKMYFSFWSLDRQDFLEGQCQVRVLGSTCFWRIWIRDSQRYWGPSVICQSAQCAYKAKIAAEAYINECFSSVKWLEGEQI